uniref:Uncharacterized protein n=1 Tax=Kalanchoe fedtschenkoi TaxID=63787 RepID=A0A7N0UJL9_KALFE
MIYASSPAQKRSEKNSLDLDAGLGPAQLKEMNGRDPLQTQINGEHGLNEIDDKKVDSEHPLVHISDEESDPGALKDVRVDEGVPAQNKNGLGGQDSVKLEERRFPDPTSEPLADVSSRTVAHQARANHSLDFESLLDQAEAEGDGTRGLSDGVVADRSFLDELMVSANNPFLEDSLFEASVRATSRPNPFEEEETSNGLLPQILDNEPRTHVEEKKTWNDTNLEAAPSATISAVDSGVPGASDNKKLPPRNSDIPAAQLQHDAMESSFASMNPYPALVSYSGQIPLSGSVSLRSESSAASNRSFAFPVLQTEWNTSPVKMAKGDRRQLRKHNGWRHALLCCNF